MEKPRPPIMLLCNWRNELVRFLLGRGVAVGAILNDYDVKFQNPDRGLLDRCEKIYRVSTFNSLEELGAIAADLSIQGITVDSVVALTEFSQYGAGYLDLVLRPGSRDPLAHAAVRDKRLMKHRVTRHGVRVAAWCSITDPDDTGQIGAVAERLRFPIVVKPAAGFGTMSTIRVDSEEELRERLRAFRFEEQIVGRNLIAEEFVEGREFHVDSLWVNGVSQYMAVCAYSQPRLASITRRTVASGSADGSLVIPEAGNEELHRGIAEMHARANEALGIRTAVTQMEVFQDHEGRLWFSELAARMAGAWGPLLLSHRYGRDIWEIVGEGLCGQTPDIRLDGPEYMGVVHLAPVKPGVVTRMPTDAEISAQDGVLGWQRMREAGAEARFSHAADWYLFVVLGAKTEEQYYEFATRASRELPILTQGPAPGSGGPSASP
jgi:hypothetical protein